MKSRIPVFEPFSWDRTFDELDRVAAFWHTALGMAAAGLGLCADHLPHQCELQFLVLRDVDVLGVVCLAGEAGRQSHPRVPLLHADLGGRRKPVAVAFSSAGPCYFDPLALRPTLMRHSWPISTRSTRCCRSGPSIRRMSCGSGYPNGGLFQGISAMPSMHNAHDLLFVLACWHLGPFIRSLTIAHMVLIYLGLGASWLALCDRCLCRVGADPHRLVRHQAARRVVGEARQPARRLALAMERAA